ncbi:MAG TPA: zf-HC2 domain-containing protein, partial [Candidatus Angelobacter sp.]|nr:zf-HC2 domain-containing protein [Candidatus Angelobacter sp.]
MPNHGPFEELCALAAAGEISAADAEALEAHLENCGSCREVLAEMQEVHAHLLPIHDDPGDVMAGTQDLVLRQTILKQARKEGATLSSDAWASGYSRPRSNSLIVPIGMLAAAVIVLSVSVGIAFEHSRIREAKPVEQITKSSMAEELLSAALRETKSNLLEVSDAKRDLEAQVQKERTEKAELTRKLDQVQATLAGSAELAEQKEQLIVDLKGQLEVARAKEGEAEAAIEQLKRADETDAVATRYEIQDLKEKLTASSASLDRERQMLSAGREIRDLIAARNLHIVDVYDTNAQGKTSRAFGRVFYTEGKSLVFYAYDL